MSVIRYSVEEINKLPSDPGVYKYYNKADVLIYVGKAKNIKKRVSSYFTKSQQNRKTQKLVSEISSVEFTVVPSEFDALLLENNLIKENQPKYNILLKDDKTFPYICITKERFPKLISTRRYNPEKGEFFGPYSSVVAMNSVLELLRKLYTIRTCSFNLSENNITNGKFKVCLEYHIGNCLGPCEGLQSEQEYLSDIEEVRSILKSNAKKVKSIYHERMIAYANQHEYEQAQKFKDKIELLDKYQSKTLVANSNLQNCDVFTIVSDEDQAFVNYLRLQNGNIIFTRTTELKKKIAIDEKTILSQFAFDMIQQVGSSSKTILSNTNLEFLHSDIEWVVPKIGDKKKLVEISLKNAFHFIKEKQKEKEKLRDRSNEAVRQLQQDLNLINPPNHIECFDNSNIQGTNPVSAMVCFKRGKPSKKDYRQYKIKTVTGPDDFASMYEVVYRRYKRVIDEKAHLPNLIVIDGGKGQLSNAARALKDLSLYGKIPIVGIAKRLEEIYVPEDQLPVHISKKSLSLKLIQQLRDEAHRFAITFHRKTRSKNAFNTKIEEIPGIGPKTVNLLLTKYKSLKKIKDIPEQELHDLIGKSKTEKLKSYIIKKES